MGAVTIEFNSASIMKRKHFLGLVWTALCGLVLAWNIQAADTPKLRVLVVTGGHDFEREAFFDVFKSIPDITFIEAQHPKAHEYFTPARSGEYDVVLLYDLWQDISKEARADFENLIKSGKGLVATHHCIASYQDWPEYARMIGGKYYLQPYKENGQDKPASTYKHDVDVKVHVVDPKHPVTKGLADFDIHDETYGFFSVIPGMTPLLTTAEPTSSPTIAWCHTYGKARVVYLELGHDHLSYVNPNYRKLIRQSILWVADK